MAIKLITTDTVLTNAAASILTAGANEANTIVKALICNNDAVARLVTIYVEPGGGAATNKIINALSISTLETKTLPLSGVAIANGAILYAYADTGSVVNLVLTVSRTEQTP